MWTTHYGAADPASQQEWNPYCPEHGNPRAVGTDPLQMPFLTMVSAFYLNTGRNLLDEMCDCDPAAHHQWDCPATPTYCQLRDELPIPLPHHWPDSKSK